MVTPADPRRRTDRPVPARPPRTRGSGRGHGQCGDRAGRRRGGRRARPDHRRRGDVRLDSATDVQVSYRLTGAIVLSESVTGRALAAAGMDVGYEPALTQRDPGRTRPGLLSLACGEPPSEPLVPCGERDAPRSGASTSPARGRGPRRRPADPGVTQTGSAGSSRPCSIAHRVSCTRLFICSLRSVFCTWFCTVRCESTSRVAICL